MDKKCVRLLKALARDVDDDTEQEYRYALKIMAKVLRNAILNPEDPKYLKIKTESSAIQKITEECPKVLKLFKNIGFELKGRSNPVYSLDIDTCSENLEEMKETYEKFVKFCTKSRQSGGFGMSSSELPSLPGSTGFDPYKSTQHLLNPVISNMHDTGCGGKFMKKLDKLKLERERIIEESGVPQRNLIVFPDASVARKFNRSNRDFEEIGSSSKSDKKLQMKAAKLTLEKSQQRKTITTKAMREFEVLKSQPVYTRARLRVVFPDGTVLQAFFSPLEKISDVAAYFATFLKHNSTNPIYLFQAPPRRVFDEDKTLEELKLVPSAMIRVGFKKGVPETEIFRRKVREMLDDREWEDIENKEDYEYSKRFVQYVKVA